MPMFTIEIRPFQTIKVLTRPINLRVPIDGKRFRALNHLGRQLTTTVLLPQIIQPCSSIPSI